VAAVGSSGKALRVPGSWKGGLSPHAEDPRHQGRFASHCGFAPSCQFRNFLRGSLLSREVVT